MSEPTLEALEVAEWSAFMAWINVDNDDEAREDELGAAWEVAADALNAARYPRGAS